MSVAAGNTHVDGEVRSAGTVAAGEVGELFRGWEEGVGEAAVAMVGRWMDELFPERRSGWRVRGVGERKPVLDSPARFAMLDERGMARTIVFVATRRSPGLVERGGERASGVRRLLGEELGQAVLTPWRSGWVEGLSVTAYPWRLECHGGVIGGRLEQRRVCGWMLKWLRGVAKAWAVRFPEPANSETVGRMLEGLASCQAVGEGVRGGSERALKRLAAGEWTPRVMLDHHDLWHGNVMVNRDADGRRMGPSRYIIIDWAGANLEGGGFADLARISRGFGISAEGLRREVAAHCAALELDEGDVESQLLFSIGWSLENREFLPLDRFGKLATDLHDRLCSAVRGNSRGH